MSWQEKLKEAGVSVHVIATGGGAGLQGKLWEVPGSSAYLSGATFPYAPEEHEELVGFKPEHFCSPEDAVDLASAAYMKAFRIGGKKPVGVGLTASVASAEIHRGDHRIHGCIITDNHIWIKNYTLIKNKGIDARRMDGDSCDDLGLFMIDQALGLGETYNHNFQDGTALARARFFTHPFFTSHDKRLSTFTPRHHHYDRAPTIYHPPCGARRDALMPGSFNPPHEGHLGMAQAYEDNYNGKVTFEISADILDKAPLTVQDMLKRAKMLHGHNVLFTQNMGMFIEKARAFPGAPLILGADTMLRIMDPKWGVDFGKLLYELRMLKTQLYVGSRVVEGKLITWEDIAHMMPPSIGINYLGMSAPLEGRWDISSTELRNKLPQDSK
jgi:hypothetical protein